MSQNERHTICELAEGSHVTSTSLEIERQDDLTIYATDQLGFDQPICPTPWTTHTMLSMTFWRETQTSLTQQKMN